MPVQFSKFSSLLPHGPRGLTWRTRRMQALAYLQTSRKAISRDIDEYRGPTRRPDLLVRACRDIYNRLCTSTSSSSRKGEEPGMNGDYNVLLGKWKHNLCTLSSCLPRMPVPALLDISRRRQEQVSGNAASFWFERAGRCAKTMSIPFAQSKFILYGVEKGVRDACRSCSIHWAWRNKAR